MQRYGTYCCTDLRDRIFATKSFVDWAQPFYLLVPDYSVNKLELVMDLVEWRMRSRFIQGQNLSEFAIMAVNYLEIALGQIGAMESSSTRDADETVSLIKDGHLGPFKRSRIQPPTTLVCLRLDECRWAQPANFATHEDATIAFRKAESGNESCVCCGGDTRSTSDRAATFDPEYTLADTAKDVLKEVGSNRSSQCDYILIPWRKSPLDKQLLDCKVRLIGRRNPSSGEHDILGHAIIIPWSKTCRYPQPCANGSNTLSVRDFCVLMAHYAIATREPMKKESMCHEELYRRFLPQPANGGEWRPVPMEDND
jgi:hypothetical protein